MYATERGGKALGLDYICERLDVYVNAALGLDFVDFCGVFGSLVTTFPVRGTMFQRMSWPYIRQVISTLIVSADDKPDTRISSLPPEDRHCSRCFVR